VHSDICYSVRPFELLLDPKAECRIDCSAGLVFLRIPPTHLSPCKLLVFPFLPISLPPLLQQIGTLIV